MHAFWKTNPDNEHTILYGIKPVGCTLVNTSTEPVALNVWHSGDPEGGQHRQDMLVSPGMSVFIYAIRIEVARQADLGYGTITIQDGD
jgi:hypothetical protein